MFSVAEFWSADAKELDKFSRRLVAPVRTRNPSSPFDTQPPSPQIAMFDVALHENFHKASIAPNYDLRRIIRGSLVDLRPRDSVTFVENHE